MRSILVAVSMLLGSVAFADDTKVTVLLPTPTATIAAKTTVAPANKAKQSKKAKKIVHKPTKHKTVVNTPTPTPAK